VAPVLLCGVSRWRVFRRALCSGIDWKGVSQTKEWMK
jgi:hypothetical protein